METQAAQLTAQLHAALGPTHDKGHKVHKVQKPFTDDHIWTLREEKVQDKKKLRRVHKQRAFQALRVCCALWHHKSDAVEEQTQEAYNYDSTLLCHQVKLYFHLRITSQTMKQQMTRAK